MTNEEHRLLDAYIAEHVFGERVCVCDHEALREAHKERQNVDWNLISIHMDYFPFGSDLKCNTCSGAYMGARHYSTWIDHAWLVVEKLSQKHFMIETRTFMNQPLQSMCLILSKWGDDKWIVAEGDTMPLAICKAARAALDELEKEV